ncbi:hypothetical protein [Rhodococcus ruber]|uniref:hypothetical protein n=1 Tax=Rhodococcus ruber TaxID=1830 RepID=UPI000EB779E7|nr:hypothetical protein [Rhodococcus ruber]AXY49255.1 hypothetical protein YT1_p10054 [Rhodococcus ruber]
MAPSTTATSLVASLDAAAAADPRVQRAVQYGGDVAADDAAIIDAHRPLDPAAAAIDWDDPTAVVDGRADGAVTVADALTELTEWDERAWPWIADEGALWCGLYLRARHAELVRRYRASPPSTGSLRPSVCPRPAPESPTADRFAGS